MAPPLAQSSPPGKEDQGRRDREGQRGKGARNRDEPDCLRGEGRGDPGGW